MWQQVVVGLVLVAAAWDIRCQKIPASLTLGGILSGLILHCYIDGWEGLLFSLQGAVAGLLFLLALFSHGTVGGGDVKLLTAIGALGGTGFVAAVALALGVVGGLLALLMVFWETSLGPVLKGFLWDGYRLLPWFNPWTRGEENPFPYGIAIALGTCITLCVW
ncbi:MAG: prepilin peptidase [Firmicutes bacterium]|nr:prepilin peptidase [Bacillota bacterium]